MKKRFSVYAIIFNMILSSAQALPNPLQDPRVKKIYDYQQDKLIWVKNDAWTSCAKTLLEAFSHADEEGLWSEDYKPFVDILQKQDLHAPDAQKYADQLLTLAALNYISDMKGERLKPSGIDKNVHLKEVVIDEAELLKEYVTLSDQCSWIYGLAPTSPDYQHLKQLLALYRKKQTEGGWPELPKGTKLKIGDKGPLIETLRAQLIAQDALPSQGQGSDVFDESLEKAVKDYQALHGLEQDGKVGGATLTALNTSVEKRIQSIIVSMEEQRWLPSPLPSRYIQVNIPGFYLKAVAGGTPHFYMPIITGKEYTKTPIFNAQMTEIIFNPSWHVPASIMGEILPKMERNPEDYARKGYYMSDGRIIQRPGNGNSLGKIRFTIESPYGVCLHGTPSVNLFKKAKRAFSHGCIRVENPYKLAEFVFYKPEEWTLSRIQAEASGTTTKPIKLAHSLPTFITYFTVFEDENHKMNFVDDEYGLDKEIWAGLVKVKRNLTGDIK